MELLIILGSVGQAYAGSCGGDAVGPGWPLGATDSSYTLDWYLT
jgi:hypothetical protein